jgi:hypothetical protein
MLRMFGWYTINFNSNLISLHAPYKGYKVLYTDVMSA